MGLFEGLTVPAKQVLVRATEAAVAMGSRQVEGAHFFLGFIDADGSAVQRVLSLYLTNRYLYEDEAKQVVSASTGDGRPAFGEEVSLTLAAAQGIAVGRGSDRVGTGTCLLALLTILPSTVEELLSRCGVDVDAIRVEAGRLDDAAEPIIPLPAEPRPWAVAVDDGGQPTWDDR
jgi:ATP-dependent Clp protease ATP-binding subunit ClpA